MESIKSFFNYLFTINPGSESNLYIPLIILSALLIVGSILFSNIYKKKKREDFAFKRLFKKLGNKMLIIGIIIPLLLVIRYENIPYFSMRIWLYVVLLLSVYFIHKYVKLYKVDYPREKINARRKTPTQKENIYLPHKKKKR